MRHLLSLMLGLRCAAAPLALEVEVVDETGATLGGAGVSADTVPRLSLDPWNAPSRRVRISAVADEAGRARLELEHALPEVMVSAAAPGFHPAACRVARGQARARLVLPRRLGSADSVRVDWVSRVLPQDGAAHGFDLAMGSPVAPLGVGRRADVWLSGACASARLPRGAHGAYVDSVVMRFVGPGDGVFAVPRPGQDGFAAAVAPACADMLLPGLAAPRLAPAGGYEGRLEFRSARGPAASDLPGPGRVGAPQWIFRITRDGEVLHGVITDFGWLDDGSLRLQYRISTESGNASLEFGS